MTAVNRNRPPATGVPRPFRFPPFEHLEIGAGLDGYFAPIDRGPVVTLELVLPGGGQLDSPPRAGLASLTAALLDDGCPTLSAPEIATFVEGLGGEVSASTDWDAAYLGLSLPSPHLEAGLELIATLATTASFPQEEIERQRQRRLQEILRRRNRASTLAGDHLVGAIFGKGPYGYPLIGRATTLPGIDRDHLTRFAAEHLRTGGAALVAAGDLDVATCHRWARQLFDQWPTVPPAERPAVEPLARSGHRVVVVDRADAPQTEIRIGHAGPLRTDPDRIPLVVMNTLLGGKFTSRINLSLREQHGFTYGAHSRLSARLGPGPFRVTAAVATESTGAAVRETLAEVRRLQDELVTADELEDTIGYLHGVFPYTLQTVDNLVSRLAQLAVFDLEDEEFDRNREALGEVGRGDIRRVARKHLRPDDAVIVAAGPARTLEPQLKTLGEVEVITPDSGEGSSPGPDESR